MESIKIYYIAGLLEGEGSFGFYQCPVIQLHMTDKDIVERARDIMCPDIPIRFQDKSSKNAKHKDMYILHFSGSLAVEWMMTLYPLMSTRRKAKIREVLDEWRKMIGAKEGRIRSQINNLTDFGIPLEVAEVLARKTKTTVQ